VYVRTFDSYIIFFFFKTKKNEKFDVSSFLFKESEWKYIRGHIVESRRELKRVERASALGT